MKKLGLFGIIAFAALFVCVMAGCSKDDETVYLTYVDNLASPTKEFIISSEYNFQVTFNTPSALEAGYGIKAGDVVSGTITGTTTPWYQSLSGTASNMTSTNDMIKGQVADLKIAISLDYSSDNETVTVAFPGTDAMSYMSQSLMGKTYYLKK